MPVVCVARGAFRTRFQPVAHLLDFLLDEFLIVKGTCQRSDTLAAGKNMHRQRVGKRKRVRLVLLYFPLPYKKFDASNLIIQ